MRWQIFGTLAAAVIAGCSEYGYRYAPQKQDIASPIFADYRVQGDTVTIMVDTDGLQLQQISVLTSDGNAIQPDSIHYPPLKPEQLRGVQEEIYGPSLAQGPTVAQFDKTKIGPGPWNVNVKVQAMPIETILVGGAGNLARSD